MNGSAPASIQFPDGTQAQMIRVAPTTPAEQIVDALGLPQPRALLVLNGGTAKLEHTLKQQLERHIADGLARVAAEEQITLISGGTDAGVFALLGRGLSTWGRTAPCIGVAVDALSQRRGHPQGDAPLEPHHSHFVLVDGKQWGDETETMYSLVHELAKHCPSIAVFAGGGSGRTTDAVLAEQAGTLSPSDKRLQRIAQSGLIIPCDIRQEPTVLMNSIRHKLFGR